MMNTAKKVRPARLVVDVEATLQVRGVRSGTRVMNVSAGGVALEARQFLRLGDYVRVRFRTSRSPNGAIDFWGRVRNSGAGRIGLEFDEITPQNRMVIEKWVNDCVLSQAVGANVCR